MISKAIDLVSGGKAVASLVPQNQNHLGDATSSSSVELSEFLQSTDMSRKEMSLDACLKKMSNSHDHHVDPICDYIFGKKR